MSIDLSSGWTAQSMSRLCGSVYLGVEDWDDWDPDGPVDPTGTEAHATDGPGLQERGDGDA